MQPEREFGMTAAKWEIEGDAGRQEGACWLQVETWAEGVLACSVGMSISLRRAESGICWAYASEEGNGGVGA